MNSRFTMLHNNRIPIPQGIVTVVTRNAHAWKRAFQDKCKDHRYYEIVEDTLLQNDFEHHYLLLEDNSGQQRAIQPVFFVRQNLVEGVPGKVRSIVDEVRKIFPRFLTMRVLMVGCAAGAGDLGVSDENDETWMAKTLETGLLKYAQQNKASLMSSRRSVQAATRAWRACR